MDEFNNQPYFKTNTSIDLATALAQDSQSAGSAVTPVQTESAKMKKTSKFPKFLTALIIILLIIFGGFFSIKNISKTQSSSVKTASTLGTENQRVDVQPPKASQTLNRQFSYPLKGTDGTEVSKFKYEIQNAELRDEIIIKGEKATAVQGRTFLVLNLKITNDYDKSIQINARDYVRLEVNKSPEKLAPDIHNDPVEIQAISTKFTRLGFPINDTDKNLVLQVGEISGPKDQIQLNLK